MRSRKYTKRIEIWETTPVPDGAGGNTVSEEKIGTSWANIKTASQNSRYTQRLTDLGVTDPVNAIIVNLRIRNDIDYNGINMFLKFKGVKYVIQSTNTNIDFNNTEVEIIAVNESTKNV